MYNNKNNNRGNHQAPLFGRPPQQAGQQQQGGGVASFGFASGAPSSFGAVPATPAPLHGTGARLGYGNAQQQPQQSQQQQQQQQKPRRLDVRDFADKPHATPAASQPQSASAASNNDSATTFFPHTLIPRSTHTPTPQQSQQQQQQKQQLSLSALGGAPSYSFGNSFSSAAPTTTTNTRPSFFDNVDVDPTATGADLVTPAHLRQAQPKQHEFTAALDVQIAARGQPQAKPWQRPRKSYEDDSMDLDDEPTVPYPEAEVEREAQAARKGTSKSVELVVVPGTPTASGSSFSASATVRPIAAAFEPHRPTQSSLSSSSSSSASSQMSKGLQTPAPNAAAARLNRGMRGVTIQTPDGGSVVRPDATVRKPDGRHLAHSGTPAPAKYSAHGTDRNNWRPEPGASRKRIDENSGETYELPSDKHAAAPPADEADERRMRPPFKNEYEYEERREPPRSSLATSSRYEEDSSDKAEERRMRRPSKKDRESDERPRSSSASSSTHKEVPSDGSIIWVNQTGYVTQALIGKGGTSTVWRVAMQNESKDTNPNLWALKRVVIKDAKDQLTKIALAEAKTLSMLNKARCESVISLHDFEIDHDQKLLSMVMELGETDLAQALKLREGKPVDLLFVRYYWRMMLECVKAVHEHKVIHSDLKPANFLIVKSALKLIDFGISKTMADNTTKATWDLPVGTLNYMSPEAVTVSYFQKAEGHVVLNRAADVWSLGCILYQMIYGRPPFSQHQVALEKMNVIADPTKKIEYYQLNARYPVNDPEGRVTQADFERLGYTGRYEHDRIWWVPLGAVVDVMERCLQHDIDDRADIDALLAHPFLNPDVHVNEKHGFRLP